MSALFAMRRLALALPLGLLLVGPAPGDTGGCTGDSVERAEFVPNCVEWSRFDCQRLSFQDPPPADFTTLQECIDRQAEVCTNIGDWPGTCVPEPTLREINNCLEALRNVENLDAPELTDIPECVFCS
ncbi:MAG: hypothetical protein AAGH15_12290 [Myxococcota bacterium]